MPTRSMATSFGALSDSILDRNARTMAKAMHCPPNAAPDVFGSSTSSSSDTASEDDATEAETMFFPRRSAKELDDLIERLFGSPGASCDGEQDDTPMQKTDADGSPKVDVASGSKCKRGEHVSGDANGGSKEQGESQAAINNICPTPAIPLPDTTIAAGGISTKPGAHEAGVWSGQVSLPHSAKFSARARQIGGRMLSLGEWKDVLSPTFRIEGRIPEERVDRYLSRMQSTSRHEIVMLQIEPRNTAADQRRAQVLMDYLHSRRRLGVVGHNKATVKDFYLLPLSKFQQIPDFLYVVRIDERKARHNSNVFVGVLVIQKPRPPPAATAARPAATKRPTAAAFF